MKSTIYTIMRFIELVKGIETIASLKSMPKEKEMLENLIACELIIDALIANSKGLSAVYYDEDGLLYESYSYFGYHVYTVVHEHGITVEGNIYSPGYYPIRIVRDDNLVIWTRL